MFKGSLVALVTPFLPNGNLDEKSLRDLLSFHIEAKTDAIVAFGTTGESPTLTDEEKIRIIKICKEELKNKVQLIAGTGTNSTHKSVELTKKVHDIGIDGVLVVVPYYNKPTQEGCVAHFREIAKVGSPLIVYHHPGRTGIKLVPKTYLELEKIPNIVAIKDASGDLSYMKEVTNLTSLSLLSGDDNLTVPVMEMGGVGVISVAANILPKEWKKLTSLCLEKKFAEAKILANQYSTLVDTLFLEPNPQCVKYALHLMGKCSPCLRLPLLEPSILSREKVIKSLKEASLIR